MVLSCYSALHNFLCVLPLLSHRFNLSVTDNSLFGSQMTPILGDYWVSARGLSASQGAMCWIPGTTGFALGSLATGKLIQKWVFQDESQQAHHNMAFLLTSSWIDQNP